MKGVEETEITETKEQREQSNTEEKENKTERNEQRKEQINEYSEKRGEESDRVQKEMEHTDSEVSNSNVSWADDHFQPSPCFPALLLLLNIVNPVGDGGCRENPSLQ